MCARAPGSALLDSGKLASALLLFEEASKLVPLKSHIGGKANLQRAITMDSMGRHAEAKSLYQQLKGHRCSEVARSARSMSFGFKAGVCPELPYQLWFCGALRNPVVSSLVELFVGDLGGMVRS